MSIHGFFLIAQEIDLTHPEISVGPRLHSRTQLSFEIEKGPFASANTFKIEDIFPASWAEDSGSTVANVQDYHRGLAPRSSSFLPGTSLCGVKSRQRSRPIRSSAIVSKAVRRWCRMQ